ncbi:MAG: glycosyltransferase, partial [Candidatus Limiplasma sp.]|nr:glycosyltransferase [Candidatus Limiplasma sp.]
SPWERKLHGAMRKLLDAEGYGSGLGTAGLVRELKQFDPDIIHLHNLHGCYLNLPMLFKALRQMNRPVLWTLHDCWPFTGHCAYFDYCGCDRWRGECHDCPQQRAYPVCVGVDGSRRNYRMKKQTFTQLERLTFVAPCEWMKGPLHDSFLGKYPVRVIPNGVSREAFRPTPGDVRARYGLGNAHVVLAVASEWDERKGLRYLTQAAQKMGKDYRFVVIGLEQAQIDMLPEGMLGITRTQDATELAAWYTAADCLANPTLEDNMPMVNLEALACGTPVAVFRTGGCPEAVDESCGRIVDKGDVEALCGAIASLCREKAAMVPACLRRAERFDAQNTFQDYLSLYKELCS